MYTKKDFHHKKNAVEKLLFQFDLFVVQFFLQQREVKRSSYQSQPTPIGLSVEVSSSKHHSIHQVLQKMKAQRSNLKK